MACRPRLAGQAFAKAEACAFTDGAQFLKRSVEAVAQLELISVDCAERGNPAGVGQMAEEVGDILNRQDRDAAAALRYLTAAEAFRAAELPIEEFRNRRQALQVRSAQYQATVGLVRALGGGWSTPS